MLATIRNSAAIFAFAIAPFAAQAGTPADASRAVVRHGDLDLSSPAGVATLERRVRSAVRSVCGSSDGRDLAQVQRVNTCREVAMQAARGDVEVAIAEARGATQMAQADGARSLGTAAR